MTHQYYPRLSRYYVIHFMHYKWLNIQHCCHIKTKLYESNSVTSFQGLLYIWKVWMWYSLPKKQNITFGFVYMWNVPVFIVPFHKRHDRTFNYMSISFSYREWQCKVKVSVMTNWKTILPSPRDVNILFSRSR